MSRGGADGGFFALLRAGDVRTLLTRYSDLALAGLVVAIVGMMIVPLPTPLPDLLISVNIATGVVLLLVAIYVSDALKIATFPTLLLLTTLFRLALEVSATRLILLRADAGEVIRAFGNFVVAGEQDFPATLKAAPTNPALDMSDRPFGDSCWWRRFCERRWRRAPLTNRSRSTSCR